MDFADAAALVSELDDEARLVLIAHLIAGALDLRGQDDPVIADLLRLTPEFRAALPGAFDYAGFFAAAPRAVAQAVIRECAGAAHEADQAWKPDAAFAEEAARLAAEFGWMPELLRSPT